MLLETALAATLLTTKLLCCRSQGAWVRTAYIITNTFSTLSTGVRSEEQCTRSTVSSHPVGEHEAEASKSEIRSFTSPQHPLLSVTSYREILMPMDVAIETY